MKKPNYYPFWKLEGAGNDFVFFDAMLDGSSNRFEWLTEKMIQKICHRQFGIGADGIIILSKSDVADFQMKYWNADGTVAGMCGNGLRCTMHFAKLRGHWKKEIARIALPDHSDVLDVAVLSEDRYEVTMPQPKFAYETLPTPPHDSLFTILNVEGREYKGIGVDVGNPHFIIPVEQTNRALAETIGKQIENHPLFPKKTNVEFVKVLDRREVELWVWERGCGITLACGSGATATIAALAKANQIDTDVPVLVHLPGGDLSVTVSHDFQTVKMSGPANIVYYGFWEVIEDVW